MTSVGLCHRIHVSPRVRTVLPQGFIISDWSFLAPWEHHLTSCDHDPGQIVPAREHHLYASLFDSRLSAVLISWEFGKSIDWLLTA